MTAFEPFFCQLRRQLRQGLRVGLTLLLIFLLGLGMRPAKALAGLHDDRYDGNIFALYAGDGSLVPPRVPLAQSLQQHRPILLVFYVDDSQDCKEYSFTLARLQAPYGRVMNFIPIMADGIPPKDNYEPNEPGYYFQGTVPQTLILDETGSVRFNQVGQVTYEALDDVFREVFDLLPRDQSITLQRRPVNEVNTELLPTEP